MPLLHADLTRSVIGAFKDSHAHLGYGFVESVYSLALAEELRRRGHRVAREVAVDVHYKGQVLATHRLDLVVDDVLVVEVKTGEKLHESTYRQLRNYLRATDLELGLALNYGPQPLFRRVIFSRIYKERAGERDAGAPRSPEAPPIVSSLLR